MSFLLIGEACIARVLSAAHRMVLSIALDDGRTTAVTKIRTDSADCPASTRRRRSGEIRVVSSDVAKHPCSKGKKSVPLALKAGSRNRGAVFAIEAERGERDFARDDPGAIRGKLTKRLDCADSKSSMADAATPFHRECISRIYSSQNTSEVRESIRGVEKCQIQFQSKENSGKNLEHPVHYPTINGSKVGFCR